MAQDAAIAGAVVQPEQQRADAAAVRKYSEAADHALRRTFELDLHHVAPAGAVAPNALLRDDAVEAALREALQPFTSDRRVGGNGAENEGRGRVGERRDELSSSLVERLVHEAFAVEIQHVECDERCR